MGRVANGISSLKDLTNGIGTAMKDGAHKVLAGSLSKLAPFMGAVGPLLNLIGLFGPSEEVQRLNQVIKMLNEGFKEITHRFNEVEKKLDSIAANIKYEHFFTRFFDPLTTLSSAKAKVKYYLDSTTPEHREAAISRLDDDEFGKVHDAFLAIKDVFLGEIPGVSTVCETLTDVSHVDRRAILDMSLRLYTRLVRAAQDAGVILRLTNAGDADRMEQEMVGWLEQIDKKIGECDENIEKGGWFPQWQEEMQTDFSTQRMTGTYLHFVTEV